MAALEVLLVRPQRCGLKIIRQQCYVPYSAKPLRLLVAGRVLYCEAKSSQCGKVSLVQLAASRIEIMSSTEPILIAKVLEHIETLKNGNDAARSSASKALSRIGETAVLLLCDTLKEKDSFARFFAAVALGQYVMYAPLSHCVPCSQITTGMFV